MPAGLDRTDRSILMGAGILVLVLAFATALLTPARRGGRAGFPSSYSPAWDGAQAAYLLLEELGYDVKRWDRPPAELENENGPDNLILILASPMQPPTSEDVAALHRFLDGGGRIVATGENVADFLPGGHKFEEGDDAEGETHFPAVLPSPLTSGAPEISMAAPTDWHPPQVDHIAVYGNKDTAAVVTYAVGKGTIIWWGSPSPLTNRGIREPGNLALLLNSIGGTRGKQILWDEYFHGARGDFWAYVAKTPLPWAFAQLGLLLLFVLLTYSRRYGTTRMPGKVSRLSPLEFVDTLGDLYASGHAGPTAVRVAYQRLRFQLMRQLGLTANATVAELARLGSRTLGWKEESLLGTLARADRNSRTLDLSDAEALEIVRDVHDYTARLEMRTASNEKRPLE
ncbi:MAG: DUF4350 domain-containing protein [Candidatus Acidiferrum sp.]